MSVPSSSSSSRAVSASSRRTAEYDTVILPGHNKHSMHEMLGGLFDFLVRFVQRSATSLATHGWYLTEREPHIAFGGRDEGTVLVIPPLAHLVPSTLHRSAVHNVRTSLPNPARLKRLLHGKEDFVLSWVVSSTEQVSNMATKSRAPPAGIRLIDREGMPFTVRLSNRSAA